MVVRGGAYEAAKTSIPHSLGQLLLIVTSGFPALHLPQPRHSQARRSLLPHVRGDALLAWARMSKQPIDNETLRALDIPPTQARPLRPRASLLSPPALVHCLSLSSSPLPPSLPCSSRPHSFPPLPFSLPSSLRALDTPQTLPLPPSPLPLFPFSLSPLRATTSSSPPSPLPLPSLLLSFLPSS